MLAFLLLLAAAPPEAQITNGVVTAKLYLPHATDGYYRGTRFDWSGVIHSLRTVKHEYFGVWFDKYDPKLHDAITGPVEEFLDGDASVGYKEAKVGEAFVRIGVGALSKIEEPAFRRFFTYDIVDGGAWKHSVKRDSAEFTHTLKDHNGYAYSYKKTLRLTKGQPELVIEHALKNTGRKAISTSQYNHNFFMLDAEPTGPAMSVTFPFEPKPKTPFAPELAEIRGKQIAYLQELPKGKSVFSELEGFGATPADFDITIANTKSGAAVRITGDRPIEKIIYWSIRSTLCPEPYIRLDIAPGETAHWTYRYKFE